MKLILLITDVGGPVALHTLLSEIPQSIRCPLVVLPSSDVGLLESSAAALRRTTALPIVMIEPHMKLEAGNVYFGTVGAVYRMVQGSGMPTLESTLVGKEEEYVRKTMENLAAVLGNELTVIFLSGRARREEIQSSCAIIEKAGCCVIALSRSETVVFDLGQQVLTECPTATELSACEIATFLESESSSVQPRNPRRPSVSNR